jgi:hypothetical protein
MSEPMIRRASTTPTLDDRLRAIVDADPGVSARRRPADHETESLADLSQRVIESASDHVGDHLIADAVGLPVVGHALLLGTIVSTPLVALGNVVSDRDAHGAAVRGQSQHDRMRGALAVLEGRIGTDTVQMEMRVNASFADGVRRAEALARTMTPAQLNELVGFVRRSGNEGQAAVCLGRDAGPAFEARYASDAAFAHGVDFARSLREDNPVAFTARVARFTELETQTRAAQQSAPIRP